LEVLEEIGMEEEDDPYDDDIDDIGAYEAGLENAFLADDIIFPKKFTTGLPCYF
jgi:hypothetical protein